jgi:hypothetical protein
MFRHEQSPFAASLLIAAFVFQMGACPCGCWEHNGWVRTLASVVSVDAHSHPATDEQHSHGENLPGLHQQGHDCDAQLASDGLAVPERWRGLRHAVSDSLSAGPLASISLDSTSDRWSAGDSVCTDGLSLRAQCQVFLL